MSGHTPEARRRDYLIRKARTGNATAAVGYAIRTGALTPQPCEVCGADETEAHHDDYNLPLAVRWLCDRHHTDWHMSNEPTYVAEYSEWLANNQELVARRRPPSGTTNNPNGRPKTAPNGERRTVQFTIALSPSEAEVVDSRRGSMSRAEYLRVCGLAQRGDTDRATFLRERGLMPVEPAKEPE